MLRSAFRTLLAGGLMACVAPLQAESTTAGDLVLFPGRLEPLVSAASTDPNVGQPGTRAGWHMPGLDYRAGTGWWALVCDSATPRLDASKGCSLHATQMGVTRAKHSVYDNDPVDSQLLHWAPLPAKLHLVPHQDETRPHLIALFKPIRSLAQLPLKAGPVTTWAHLGMPRYAHTARHDTLEVRLPLPDGSALDVVPRGEAGGNGIGCFELQRGTTRQRLDGYATDSLEGMPTDFKPSSFLLWAGDLDGDGRPDFLFNHGGSGWHIAMYLSSLAKPGELVGLAGRFQYMDPSIAGC